MNQANIHLYREGQPKAEGETRVSRTTPAALRNIESTGLSFVFLVELLLKILFQGGQLRLWDVRNRSRLPLVVLEPLIGFMRSERLCEIFGRSQSDADTSYILTDLGRERAQVAMEKNQYAGPCPVTLADYVAQVEKQTVRDMHIGRDAMHQAFDSVVLADGLLDQVGPALNAGRAIFIYGPSGSGKTFLAERLAGALGGSVYIPYAVAIDGEVIQVFDPLVHHPLEEKAEEDRGLDRRHGYDERWIQCSRPVVLAGGELTMSMLDLQFEANARFYAAPVQMKANNGLLIIDDLGRQRVDVRDLLNRWITPLDRQVDYLALHTGRKFQLPFDVALVFSTNLTPRELGDEAFLRRLGYKVFMGPLPEGKYRELFQQTCSRLGVPFNDGAFEHLVHGLHAASDRPFLACYPYDIVSKARDHSMYTGTLPELSDEILDWAWSNYFGTGSAA